MASSTSHNGSTDPPLGAVARPLAGVNAGLRGIVGVKVGDPASRAGPLACEAAYGCRVSPTVLQVSELSPGRTDRRSHFNAPYKSSV